jgi:hypothetical protein
VPGIARNAEISKTIDATARGRPYITLPILVQLEYVIAGETVCTPIMIDDGAMNPKNSL